MCATGRIFRVAITGKELWDLYLNSFENDPIFRDPDSSQHNCNACNSFIRRYGNVVAVDSNNRLMTMFDVEADEEYQKAIQVLSEAIRSSQIEDVFVETLSGLQKLAYGPAKSGQPRYNLGIKANHKIYSQEEAEKFGVIKAGETKTFDHLSLEIDKAFIDSSGRSVENIQGFHRDNKNVFARAMEEIDLDTTELVLDLIDQGALLDGKTHKSKVQVISGFISQYNKLADDEKDNWCWVVSHNLPIAKFRNELIGVLCVELALGEDLETAVRSWNKRVDPANYMKTKSPITQKQINEAKQFVEEYGYTDSFNRRFARIDDISVSEILHANAGAGDIKAVSIFDAVKPTAASTNKKFDFSKVEEIDIEDFMKTVLPGAKSLQVYLENRHEPNMVSLTTSNVPGSKPIFKWDNNYTQTFNGNLAGNSLIKAAVKAAGGNVEGVLNFRLAWNDEAPHNDGSDLDLWASEPGGTSIGFSMNFRKDKGNHRSPLSGQLDVDCQHPGPKIGVENITWIDLSKMKDGVYKVWVNQYAPRNSKGFKVEVAFGDETYLYEYRKPVGGNIQVAEVTLSKGVFSIKHILPCINDNSSKELYSLETNKFHQVNLVCLSPNHWGTNSVGNKHYLFMLDGAKSPNAIRSFHIENLKPELLDHKRVFEVLGSATMIPSTDGQLSGVGFNSTVRDEVIVKSDSKVYKILF